MDVKGFDLHRIAGRHNNKIEHPRGTISDGGFLSLAYGIGFLLVVRICLLLAGSAVPNRSLIMAMLIPAVLCSHFLTGTGAILLQRYLSDMLFEERERRILPPLEASLCAALAAGLIGYGLFLCFTGLRPPELICSMLVFLLWCVIWVERNFLSVFFDLQDIRRSYESGLVATAAGMLILTRVVPEEYGFAAVMIPVFGGLSLTALWMLRCLLRTFPEGSRNFFTLLQWNDRHPTMLWTGLLSLAGTDLLLLLLLQEHGWYVRRLLYDLPQYAGIFLLFVLAMAVTGVYAVASLVPTVYPHFRKYYEALDGSGGVADVEQAQHAFLLVLRQQTRYAIQLQLYVTLFLVTFGVEVIKLTPLVFAGRTLVLLRILCIGVSILGISDLLRMHLLMLADEQGALVSALLPVMIEIGGFILRSFLGEWTMGVCFLAAGLVSCLFSVIRILTDHRTMIYRMLEQQPIEATNVSGFWTYESERLDKKSLGAPALAPAFLQKRAQKQRKKGKIFHKK